MNHAQTVKKSLTIYEDQLDFVKKLADEKHRGKISRALQEIIEREMERQDGNMIAAEPGPNYPKFIKKRTDKTA